MDGFVFETRTEMDFIDELASYIKEKSGSFVQVQFSLDRTGYTKRGIIDRIKK